MTRFKAFGIHLGISFIIFIFLAYLVVMEWYPGLLFDTDGGWRGMRIIIGVDLVLGPLLTLVAYKAGKPGLKFDLTCIALLQTVCLIAGTWVVWEERPLGIVYVDSRFQVMSPGDYQEAEYPVPDFDQFGDEKPLWLQVLVPEDLEKEAELRKKYLSAKGNLALASDEYEPFDSKNSRFIADARDLSVITSREDGPAALDAWIAKHGGSIDDYNFYTFSTRYTFEYIGFREATGEQLGFLNITPR